MIKFFLFGLLLNCSFLLAQENLIVLPVKVTISPEVKTGLFTSAAKTKAKREHLSQKARILTADYQKYTDEVLRELKAAYAESALFLSNSDEIPDSLGFEYAKFTGSIDQAFYRNQLKKDEGPLTVSIAKKGQSNKALKEKNKKNLLDASKPFEEHFKAPLFLSVKVIGKQNSPLKSKGIYGGIRIQVIVTEASTGATVFFKTHSQGTMRTMLWDSKRGYVPHSEVGIRKNSFQAKLESMLTAGIKKANKIASKG